MDAQPKTITTLFPVCNFSLKFSGGEVEGGYGQWQKFSSSSLIF